MLSPTNCHSYCMLISLKLKHSLDNDSWTDEQLRGSSNHKQRHIIMQPGLYDWYSTLFRTIAVHTTFCTGVRNWLTFLTVSSICYSFFIYTGAALLPPRVFWLCAKSYEAMTMITWTFLGHLPSQIIVKYYTKRCDTFHFIFFHKETQNKLTHVEISMISMTLILVNKLETSKSISL